MLIIYEDEDLLVINKPAGMNTHAPAPYAGQGIYEWLRDREPRWEKLAIVHRLDKETSGVMVFGKSAIANRSLTKQFTEHSLEKKYVLVTDRPVKQTMFTARSVLVRAGEKYLSRSIHAGGDLAETEFRFLRGAGEGRSIVEARPITGRTHQIRAHASEHGFPILGDELYGGTPADRVWLHAEEISLAHPASSKPVNFRATADFAAQSRLALREGVIDAEGTNAYRLIHGASDKWPSWYVDRLGDFLLSQAEGGLSSEQRKYLAGLLARTQGRGAYHKTLMRQVRQTNAGEACPKLVLGEATPGAFTVKENGVNYELSFGEGYSVGLFLDQRDNRRRFLVDHVAAGFPLFGGHSEEREVLNTFAYTCSFSVCAALGRARVTSVDLSKKYLEWGKRNFSLNGLNPAHHDFIHGDVFDWLRRMARKQRRFDAVILDPPTFSQSRESGVFRAEKDYGSLVQLALAVLKPDGVLLASTNAAKWPAEEFIDCIKARVGKANRSVRQLHYAPQPPDFPVTKMEPAYLKTLWLRVS